MATRADIQAFINATRYGVDYPESVANREARLTSALDALHLGQTKEQVASARAHLEQHRSRHMSSRTAACTICCGRGSTTAPPCVKCKYSSPGSATGVPVATACVPTERVTIRCKEEAGGSLQARRAWVSGE